MSTHAVNRFTSMRAVSIHLKMTRARHVVNFINHGNYGETERAVLDGVMNREGFFYQLLSQARAVILDNVKSLGGELDSIS